MPSVLFIPMHDWRKCLRESFRTRDAHWMQELARRSDIDQMLVVNRPRSAVERFMRRGGPDPMPSLELHPAQPATPATRLYRQTVHGCSVNILDIDLPDTMKVIRYRRDWWKHALDHPRTRAAIDQSLRLLNIPAHELILWLETPFAAGLLDQIDARVTIFDGLDDWSNHPDIVDRHGYIAEGYAKIARDADLIFTNSDGLAARLNTLRNERSDHGVRAAAQFVGNGVDVELFQSGRNSAEPPELEGIVGPRIGFFGKFTRKVDLDLLCATVERAPDAWRFILAGPVQGAPIPSTLLRHRSVTWLGDIPYERLPTFFAHLNVGIIPYVPAHADNMFPLKFYEYLAADLPLVTTCIDGIEPDWPGVALADDADGFIESIAHHLHRTERTPLHRSISMNYAWRNRLDQILACALPFFDSQEPPTL